MFKWVSQQNYLQTLNTVQSNFLIFIEENDVEHNDLIEKAYAEWANLVYILFKFQENIDQKIVSMLIGISMTSCKDHS